MEERVKQFYTEASVGLSKKTPKEITTLRKFMFKNQEHRFTDSQKGKLYDSILIYSKMYNPTASESPIHDLLADALKMPFTVFSTSQKKKLMKLYQDTTSATGSTATPSSSVTLPDASEECREFQIFDISETDPTWVSLLMNKGDTKDFPISTTHNPSNAMMKIVEDSLDKGQEIFASVSVKTKQVVAVRVVE